MKKPKSLKVKNNMLKITAYGAANEVGRSAFIIEDNNRKILIDAGIKLIPRDLSLAPEGLKERAHELDAVVLSHAHIDHSGYLPSLWENGYYGKLYMTEPTRDIVRILWADHLKIEGERHWSAAALERAIENTITIPYKKKIEIVKGVTIELFNAGHILGAAMILVNWDGFKILYTGDINDQQTPLFNGFEIPNTKIDVLITETTNGLRKITPRAEVNRQFVNEVLQTLKNGKKVIIPAFAVGRSQEILCVLTEQIRNYPIYIDGMINRMNEITERYLNKDWVDEQILDRLKKEKIFSPFRYDNITPISWHTINNPQEFRKFIGNSDKPAIIITTSGMSEPSPVHTHYKYNSDDKGNLIAIIGYQAEGTTGRDILNGARDIIIFPGRNADPEQINIKARVVRFGFSGHTSNAGVEMIIKELKPKQIILVHGDHEEQLKVQKKLSNGVIPRIIPQRKPLIIAQERK